MKKIRKLFSRRLVLLFAVLAMAVTGVAAATTPAYAANTPLQTPNVEGKYQCGSGQNAVEMSINIGCYGKDCQSSNPHGCSALVDGIFAIIRFLSAGVGVVVVGSIVWAGIQYATSRGDPAATAKAVGRLQSTGIALLMFIFGYAILNYLIPAGFFK